MKFLADENVDRPVIYSLRNKGFDIKSVDEDFKGISDSEVLEKALSESRVLITFDSDFSKIDSSKHCGVIRITSLATKSKVVKMIEEISDNFSVEDINSSVVEVSPSEY